MSAWAKEKKQDIILKVILFLISPFFAFLYSLRKVKTKSSYYVFFLTSVFFGMAFTVPSGYTSGQGGFDGQYYRAKFELYQNISGWDFIDGFKKFLAFDEGNKDYYFDTVAFYLSRLTDNYHIMFMVCAIVFAIFSLKSFRFLTAEKKFDASISSYILAYLFMSNQIFNINGLRFWTAAWVAVFCIFHIYRNGDKRYFFLALITPFFHGSYWVFIGILVVIHFFRRFEKTWIILFFMSFFISSLAVELIQYVQPYLPTFLSRSVESYTNAEYIQMKQSWSGFGWLPLVFSKLSAIYLNIMVFLFIRHSAEIKENPKTKELFLFLLVWVSICNFFMFVPSLGVRYIVLVYPIIAYVWLVNFKGNRYKFFILVFPIAFIWSIFTQVGYYMAVTSFDFYILNPFYLIYKYLFIS